MPDRGPGTGTHGSRFLSTGRFVLRKRFRDDPGGPFHLGDNNLMRYTIFTGAMVALILAFAAAAAAA
ncbi:MAG: hypothetical protein GF346_11390, partial [Candidatus Eisenbacteria bacterium]|nr:hypothetical protein [Candidatus Latescibacterota bacterium]MBD3303039.1 hypothetical protein [Candidatus Eisenbacteria bacterium]